MWDLLTSHRSMLRRSLLVLLVLYSGLGSLGHGVRPVNRIKRIINGEDLRERDSGYLVTNYFVWISNKHICGGFDSFRNFLQAIVRADDFFRLLGYYKCDVDPQKLLCGGALLTPTIVQTACHCVATELKTEDFEGVQRFQVNDAYSDMALVYHGSSTTADMNTGYISKMFITHPKCQTKAGIIMNDYGYIVLQTAIAPDANFASNPLNFAPVYSEKSLKYVWDNVNSKETVCLFVGFGRITDYESTKPSVMQHSWSAIHNYQRCYSWMTLGPGFNYTAEATWSCSSPLPPKSGRVNNGDSGSPVTCDNEYFGLISSGRPFFEFPANPKFPRTHGKMVTNMTKTAPIVFALFANTAENRVKFEEATKAAAERVEKTRGLGPTPRKLPTNLLSTTSPDDRNFKSASSGTALLCYSLQGLGFIAAYSMTLIWRL